LRSLFVRSLIGITGLSIVVAIGIWLLAPLMINVVSSNNPDFAPSVQVLQWLGVTIPLFFVTNILLWTIMTLGKQKALMFYYGIAAILNIGLNIWLIPQYGYLAAIVTTGISEVVALLFMGTHVWILLKSRDILPEVMN